MINIATNVGKIFENNFKACVPDNIIYYRLQDPPQSFNKSESLRFSWKNPCDCFLFDGETRTFYSLELKSSKSKSFSYELEKGINKTANIHFHQIEGLRNFAKYNGVVSGFIFNFRYDNLEHTYFQEICDFDVMVKELNKKSFNELDLIKYNPIKINQTLKKVNYKYDVSQFLRDTINEKVVEILECSHPQEQRRVYPWAQFCLRCNQRL